jgi:hypothetical protein
MSAALRGLVALTLGLVATSGLTAAPKDQESSRTRRELEALQRAVEGAVGQVARPVGGLMGAHGGRAYRLPGTGIVVMVSPRWLPVARRAAIDPQVTRALDEALKGLQESLKRADSDEVRADIRRDMQQLRETRIRLVNRRDQPMRLLVDPQMEAQVLAMNQHAEQFRREAEEAQREAERELQGHLRTLGVDIALPPVPPAALEAPLPPQAPGTPSAPVVAPAPEAPGLLVNGGEALMQFPPLPPAPWEMWFSLEGEADDRSADQVLAAVRDAVGSALAQHRGPWSSLSGEETVSVAVDFLPQRGGEAPRTLVLRLKAADLAARLSGKLDAAELRRRIHADEY